MRIVHVASSYPLTETDGTAPFMAEMLGALASRGHQVSIVVPRVDGLVEGERRGVRVVGARYAPSRLQTWGYGRSLGPGGRLGPLAVALTPVAILSLARTLRSLVRSEQPDLVHLHWVLPQGVLAAVVPQRIPIVISAHGADARVAVGRLKPVARRVMRRADALIAASSEILDRLAKSQDVADEKKHVIPHGADSKLLAGIHRQDARKLLDIPASQTVILGIGRLVAKKGFHNLVAAMAKSDLNAAHLYLIGDGPEHAKLAERARGQDAIHLVGKQSREAVAQWYAAADLVVVPSRPIDDDVDSGPVVLVETLAAGRALVTTSVGMAPALIEDGINGILVADPSPDELSEAIRKGLQMQPALESAARATFETLGDWERVAEQLEQVYESVLLARP